MASAVATETTVTPSSRPAAEINPPLHYRPLKPDKVSGLRTSEIEAVAEGLARELDYSPRDNIQWVVRKLGGEVRLYNPDGEGAKINGLTLVSEDGSFQVLLPASSSFEIDKLIIAKELGHYFLHHLYSGAQSDKGTELNKEPGSVASLSETEAEVFALCFLMPKAQFRKDVRITGGKVGILSSLYGIPEGIIYKRQKLMEKSTKK